jgi:hypothetical protein
MERHVISNRVMRSCGSRFGVCVFLVLLWGPAVASAEPTPSAQPATTGRVVATITTLEGTVHMPGVSRLRDADNGIVIAKTETDGAGQVTFPDVPIGRYLITASGPGFLNRDSTVFDVRANETAQVILDAQLTFVLPGVQVRADTPSPTDSVQPVSMSDMLSGSLFETAPLEGDDFRSLLPLLPGVVRDGNGRLRIKGGQPTQSALQISSASLVDPSTGDFDLDLPSQSVDSVEVMANPFAAEYGRFSVSITQIRTRGGTNDWDFSTGNWVPRFRAMFRGVRGFEPRASIRGPIRKDRLFLVQDFQFRYVNTPVKSLPDEPEVGMTSFDSFTRLDSVMSARHVLSTAIILFPRKVDRVTMNTFRPAATTPEWRQEGASAGGVDRLAISSNLVLESTFSLRHFQIEVDTDNLAPMVYAPETQSGGFFNDQERNVRSYQWVEALSLTRDLWRGQHVFKFGTDLQRSDTGLSASRPVEIRRRWFPCGAHRVRRGVTVSPGDRVCDVRAGPLAMNSRLTFELACALIAMVSAKAPTGRRERARPLRCCRKAARSTRRVRQIRPAHAAQCRGLRGAIRATHDRAFQRRWLVNRPADHVDQQNRWRASHARSRSRQHRMGPAVWPSGPSEGGVPGALRLARACGVARSRGWHLASWQHRLVGVQGTREHGAVSGWRAPRPDDVVCVGARYGRFEPLRRLLRQLPQSDHPCQ